MKGEEKAGRRGCVGRLARWGVVGGGLSFVAALVGLGIGGWYYRDQVVQNPGAHMSRENVYGVVVQESPVYFRDGTTRIGVFFEDEHREFLTFEELPRAYVMAIVAAEDGDFWRHYGVSPQHIARAMVQNMKSGRVVAGGSTLTQQTAKNLFYRPDRSFRSKWVELLNALRLEAHFSKEEILTFYANQFHVSGNGRGLAIATRYFFDKDAAEIFSSEAPEKHLVEQAFLAGLVKAPSYYDPFLGDPERRERSRARAHDRTRYVLKRLVDEPAENLAGPLPKRGDPASQAAYQERLAQAGRVKAEAARLLADGFELPFRRGTFRYESSAVLDEISRRLKEPPFDEVLRTAGITDPAKAGLQVVTTLDVDAQREATYGLWHHLTEVGAWLERPGAADFIRADSRGPVFDPDQRLTAHEFRVGRVQARLEGGGKPHLDVDLGGRSCLVDRDAVVRAASAVYRGEKNDRFAKVPTERVNAFVDALPVGSVVWVSLREVPAEGPPRCDLERRPTLQGAAMIVENGEVRAMVGGNDNKNFNRATALRQFGSTWKPLVYHAALRVGWSPTDLLDNQRNVFPYSTTFYYPSPDHNPAPAVSMAWAGVNSENLSSVWLLYHLLDRLPAERLRELAVTLDLARREGEAEADYRVRIQKAGVLPTPARVPESLFLQARQEVLDGLASEGREEDRLALESLLYGWGFNAERGRVASEPAASRARKERALANSWLYLVDQMDRCETQHRALLLAVKGGKLPTNAFPTLTYLEDAEGIRLACGAPPLGYSAVDAEILATWAARVDSAPPEPPPPSKNSPSRFPFWPRATPAGEREEAATPADFLPELAEVRVDDRLHHGTLTAVRNAMARRELARRAAGEDAPDLYSPEILYWHQDFRVLMAMKYLTAIAREFGVQTPITEVMAMPLGASEITLEEAVMVYEGLSTGRGWTFPGHASASGPLSLAKEVPGPAAPTLLIQEIRDVDGNVLYRARPQSREVTTPEIAAMSADILRNVVRFGTGRRALDAVAAGGASVPFGGKTGTTNDFRNAAFLGYYPKWVDGGWSVVEGYTVGVYVGYDDNRKMDTGKTRLDGAKGALPAWVLTAQGLHSAGLLGEAAQAPADLGAPYWTIGSPSALVRVGVDAEAGIPAPGAAAGPSDATVLTRPAPLPQAVLVRVEEGERPPRIAPSTLDLQRLLEERFRKMRERSGESSVWDQ